MPMAMPHMQHMPMYPPGHPQSQNSMAQFYMGQKGPNQNWVASKQIKRGKQTGRTMEGQVYNMEDYFKMPDNEDDSDDEQGTNEQERGYMKLFKKNKHTSRPNQLLVCTTCGNTFTKLCNVMDHIRMHRGLRPFMCKYCN